MKTLIAFLLGFALALAIVNGPDCPTEDSCVADYSNGQWHIIRVIP